MGAETLRRHELAAFLRSRRERVTPEDAGLPSGYRRRTAGLRREEVAQLSGVGVTWYTWLEQGRPIRASVQVLEAVARTLRLDAIERQHLFRLAEVPDKAHPDESGPVLRPQIQVVLDGLNPMPASVTTERFDILAWNTAYGALLPHVVQPRVRGHVGHPGRGPSALPRQSVPASALPAAGDDLHQLRGADRARYADGRLHPRQRGHQNGHGTARGGPGPVPFPLLARAPGAYSRPSYDLGTPGPMSRRPSQDGPDLL
jgi:transcriptional regulator with XRE-family HTH domain